MMSSATQYGMRRDYEVLGLGMLSWVYWNGILAESAQ